MSYSVLVQIYIYFLLRILSFYFQISHGWAVTRYFQYLRCKEDQACREALLRFLARLLPPFVYKLGEVKTVSQDLATLSPPPRF